MLDLTEQAVEAIRNIVEEGEVGPNGGLRISGSNEGNGDTALEFELAPEPAAGDAVVREGGASVFGCARRWRRSSTCTRTATTFTSRSTTRRRVWRDGARCTGAMHGDHFHFTLDDADEG